MNYSNFMSLVGSDWVKSFVMFVFSAVVTTVYQSLSTGIDWKMVLGVALTSAVSYIAKNLLTTSQGKLAGIQVEPK